MVLVPWSIFLFNLEIISGNGRDQTPTKQRKLREAFWIKELRTVYPYGLNDRCNGQDWFNRNEDDITSTIFNKTKIVRKKRSNKKIHNFSKIWNYEEFLRKVNNCMIILMIGFSFVVKLFRLYP